MTQDALHLGSREIVSLVQMVVFLVAGTSLFSIWKIGDPAQRNEKEASILFLAFACLLWSIMAIVQYRQVEPADILRLPSLFRTLLSIVNSAFILGATAGLDAFQKWLQPCMKKWLPTTLSFPQAVWVVMGGFVTLGFGASMILMLINSWYASVPDIFLGSTTLVIVLGGLYKSFSNRGFRALAWLSVSVVGLYIMVQFSELPWLANLFERHKEYDDLHWAANLSLKTMLCLLFMALIVSWMYEKATKKPKPFLKVDAPYHKGAKVIFKIEVGFSIDGSNTIELDEKGYLRMLEIALKWREMGKPIRTADLYHQS